MAEKFDPYYTWLSISPQNQPPNLYRLLGLELFERDPKVIDAAADRQMNYIRTCAAGKYAEYSQQLLNEIAAARRRLLDLRLKKQYDEQLRATLAKEEELALAPLEMGPREPSTRAASPLTVTPVATAPVATSPLPVLPSLSAELDSLPNLAPAEPRTLPSDARPSAPLPTPRFSVARRPRRRSNPWIPVAVIGVALLSVVGAIGWLMSSPGPSGAMQGRRSGDTGGRVGERSADGSALKESHRGKSAHNHQQPGSPLDDESGRRWEERGVNAQSLLAEALDALRRGDVPAAVVALEKIVQHPAADAAAKDQSRQMLGLIHHLNNDGHALEFLMQMDEHSFAAFRHGAFLRIENVPEMYWPVFHAALRRNLPEAQWRRGVARAAQQSHPAQPLPDQPVDVVSGDPADRLHAKGLKLVEGRWVLDNEDAIADSLERLLRQYDDAKDERSNLVRQQRSQRNRLERLELAKSNLERELEDARRGGRPASDLANRIEYNAERIPEVQARLREIEAEIYQKEAQLLWAANAVHQGIQLVEEGYRQKLGDPDVVDAATLLGQSVEPGDELRRLLSRASRVPLPR